MQADLPALAAHWLTAAWMVSAPLACDSGATQTSHSQLQAPPLGLGREAIHGGVREGYDPELHVVVQHAVRRLADELLDPGVGVRAANSQ